MSESQNKRVVLIMGKPSTGKTASLMKMANDSSVAYLNTDLKDTPFRLGTNGMRNLNIDDAMIAPAAIDDLENSYPEVKSVILDTITFLMDQYETQYVLEAADTRSAWGGYGMFYKKLMHSIKSSEKNYIVLAHAYDVYDEAELSMETKVPIKGAVGRTGVEADYNIILSTKKMTVKSLQPFIKGNKLLNISAKEEAMGIKYVFQTTLTKDTIHEKIRSPMGLWKDEEVFIDNDINHIIKRLKEYYR